MRAIDADALEKYLSDAEIEAIRQRRYVFASALNTICGNVRNFPTIEPDRSLWFCIGEICVDESKGFISAGRAVEKIRELLREAERQEG